MAFPDDRNSSISAGRPLVEAGRAVLAEHLEDQAVRVTGRHPGHLEPADAILELRGKRCIVIVLDRLVLLADRDVVVAHHVTKGQRSLRDGGAETATADREGLAAEEFRDVGQVAADVG